MRIIFLFLGFICLATYFYFIYKTGISYSSILTIATIFIILSFIKELSKYVKEINIKEGKILMNKLNQSILDSNKLIVLMSDIGLDVVYSRVYWSNSIGPQKGKELYSSILDVLENSNADKEKIKEIKEKYNDKYEQLKNDALKGK